MFVVIVVGNCLEPMWLSIFGRLGLFWLRLPKKPVRMRQNLRESNLRLLALSNLGRVRIKQGSSADKRNESECVRLNHAVG